MLALALALVAAVAYGLADFTGGLVSQRANPWSVALVAQVVGAASTVVVALLWPGEPTGRDFAWALAAGVANGVGTAFLYRGLSSGRMGVVAPISGVGAALIPVLVGVALGERPALLAWLGIAVAAPGIWLVAREPATGASDPGTARGALDGVLAGVGFGTLFVCLERISDDAGFLPLALNQAVAGVAVVGVAAAYGAPWWPRQRRALLGGISGVLALAATASFLLSTHHGYLSITAVITSLYPAVTVVLAASVLREPIRRDQTAGLLCCLAAIGLVAAG